VPSSGSVACTGVRAVSTRRSPASSTESTLGLNPGRTPRAIQGCCGSWLMPGQISERRATDSGDLRRQDPL